MTNDEHIATLPTQVQQRIIELRGYDRRTVKVLYRSLSAPPLEELNGEYHAELLHQGDRFSDWLTRGIFRMAGKHWAGKAFQAIGPDRGCGYNWFLEPQSIRRKLPMKTSLGEATVAVGSAVIVDYSQNSNLILRSMRDEIRKWDDGLYVGFGQIGPRLGKRHGLCRLIPFLLAGPVRPFATAAA